MFGRALRANALRAMVQGGRPKAQRCESCRRAKKRCHHALGCDAEIIQEHNIRVRRESRQPERLANDDSYGTAIRDQRISHAVAMRRPSPHRTGPEDRSATLGASSACKHYVIPHFGVPFITDEHWVVESAEHFDESASVIGPMVHWLRMINGSSRHPLFFEAFLMRIYHGCHALSALSYSYADMHACLHVYLHRRRISTVVLSRPNILRALNVRTADVFSLTCD